MSEPLQLHLAIDSDAELLELAQLARFLIELAQRRLDQAGHCQPEAESIEPITSAD